MVIPQVPSLSLVIWGIKSREYLDGIVLTLDANNMPLERLFFKQGTCIHFEMNYKNSFHPTHRLQKSTIARNL